MFLLKIDLFKVVNNVPINLYQVGTSIKVQLVLPDRIGVNKNSKCWDHHDWSEPNLKIYCWAEID